MLKELTKSSRSSIKKTNDGQLNSNRSEINQDNLQNLSYSKDNSKIIQNSQSQSKIADKLTKENSSYNERTIDTTIKSNTIKQRLNNFISDVKSQSRVKSSSVNKGTKCTSPVKDISSYYELTNRQTNLTYTKNVSKLESWIDEIKTKGFNKLRCEIEAKQAEIKQLEISINTLQRNVNYSNGQRKHYCTKEGKLVSEISQFQQFGERFRREVYYMQKEMPSLRKEIPELKEDFTKITEETKIVKRITNQEEKELITLKDEIARTNKKISEVIREKENLRNGINLLKKHTEVLKDKIQSEDKKCKDFMQNVSTLVDSTLR